MMRIRRILYPTDFSATATQALKHALFLAEQFEAELHMLHAIILHESDPRDPDRHFPEPSEILPALRDRRFRTGRDRAQERGQDVQPRRGEGQGLFGG